MAQRQTKPTAPAGTDKPQHPPENRSKEPKVEKKETPQAMRVSGTVAVYEASKMIKVKGKDNEMAFDLTGDTKVKGDVKDGAKVTVMYKKEGTRWLPLPLPWLPRRRSRKRNRLPLRRRARRVPSSILIIKKGQ